MLIVNVDGSLQLTRGDYAELEVAITNATDGSQYTIQESDTLTLSVKKSVKDSAYVLQKQIVGSNLICIEPEDTANLTFAQHFYDVQLTTTDGKVFTVIPPTIFEITAEVTCPNES